MNPISNLISNDIAWPDASAIPGATLRHTLGETDWPRMVEIINAAHVADGLEEVLSVEEKANDLRHLEHFDPAADVLCIDVNGLLVAFAKVEWRIDDEGNRLYDPDTVVHPDFRHLGLLPLLYEFSEMRARQMARTEHFDQPQLMSQWVPLSAQPQIVLLRDLGYAPVRYFYLMQHVLSPIPEVPMPAGLVLRPVDTATHLRAIWDAKEEAFADHWGHGQRSEADFLAWRDNPTIEHDLWQVAWDEAAGEIAGLSVNTIFHADNAHYGFKRGWIETLGVRRKWRGRSLAKALLSASMHRMQAAGMTEVALGVDAANPTGALQLYENMGFRLYSESAVWRKQID